MNSRSSAISAALARAWRAVAKAFAPASDAPASQQYGADTTLFGGVTEQPRERAVRHAGANEFWVPTETTDFADIDGDRDPKRRR